MNAKYFNGFEKTMRNDLMKQTWGEIKRITDV